MALKAPGAETAYAGNEACRACHPREFTAHAQTPHARTVRQVFSPEDRPEFHSPQAVTDPAHGVTYSVHARDGRDWLTAWSGGRHSDAPVRWIFGSGTHAWSYLGQDRSGFLEFRITYYRPSGQWNFTPGRGPGDDLPQPLGHVYNNLAVSACFGCHSTVLVGTPEKLALERSLLNVGCESCHGPGSEHIRQEQADAKGAPAPDVNWCGDLTEIPTWRARCTSPAPRTCSRAACWASP